MTHCKVLRNTAAQVPELSGVMQKEKKKIQKEHLQQSALNHNNSDPIHCIIFIMDGASTMLD